MKKRTFTRILILLLALMAVLPLCLSIAGSNQANAAEHDGPVGIFALRLENKSESAIYSAFLLYDEETDNHYILADPSVYSMAERGFEMTLLTEEYQIEAECLGHDGYFAYLGASGMGRFRPLLLSETYSEQIYVFIQQMDEKKENAVGQDFVYCDMRQWTKEGRVYLAPDVIFNSVIGAPAVKDMSTYEVVGTIGDYEGHAAFFPAEDYDFTRLYSVENLENPKPVPSEPEDDKGEIEIPPALIIGIAVIGGFAIYAATRKKPAKQSPAQNKKEGTVALGATPVKNDFPPLGAPAASQWQIRGMGGPMDGRVFLLTSTLRFGRNPQNEVAFSGSTPGISGSHCQLSYEHGRVVLRDLQSTYGTYMGGRKLEPQISYNLQNGDTFTLAENAQTFRLERSGNSVQDMTPAVRGNADGRTYRADMNGCISFGRDPRSQVPFPQNDSSVSTNHCVLYRENGQLYLKDTNSTNGTFFDENNRLKPNKPYKVRKGMTFFLVSPQNSFVITED